MFASLAISAAGIGSVPAVLAPSVSNIKTRLSAGRSLNRLTDKPMASPIAVEFPAKPSNAS